MNLEGRREGERELGNHHITSVVYIAMPKILFYYIQNLNLFSVQLNSSPPYTVHCAKDSKHENVHEERNG